MPKIAFSDVGLRNIKPPPAGQIDYWDEKLPAFGLRVSQGGSKRNNSRITIGRFGVLGLSEARTEAKRMLAEFTLGKIRPQSITYPQAVRLFIEDKKRHRRANTYEGYEWLLGRFPFKGQISQITGADMARVLKSIKSRSTYDHALVAARIFFNWAIKRRYVTENPTFGISRHGTPTRSRVLSDEELQSVWQACDGKAGAKVPSLPATYCAIIKFLILTGQRRGEIASLRSEYIKDGICTLPAALTKNGREHSFPIGTVGLTLMADIKPNLHGLLFPALGKPTKPFNGWSKCKKILDQLSGVSNFTIHDLRRTYASKMASLGVAPHIVERLLNHVSGTITGVAAVYNRYQFMPEMKAAVAAYENHLATLLAAK